MLYLSQDSHQELYTFIQTKWQCFKWFIAFYTNLTHLLNKQTGFFDKMCQQNQLQFYNYSSVLQLPNHSSITTNFKQYGSYRIAESFDLPMQNTIKVSIKPHFF